MFNDKLTNSVADAALKCMTDEQKNLEESKYTENKDKQGKMKSWKYEGDWEDSKEKKEGRGKVTHMSDVARRASERMKKDDANVKEEVELTESELEEMTVPELRRLARSVPGLTIFGREISKANKETLIQEILSAHRAKN